jgi:hypothetical protein
LRPSSYFGAYTHPFTLIMLTSLMIP